MSCLTCSHSARLCAIGPSPMVHWPLMHMKTANTVFNISLPSLEACMIPLTRVWVWGAKWWSLCGAPKWSWRDLVGLTLRGRGDNGRDRPVEVPTGFGEFGGDALGERCTPTPGSRATRRPMPLPICGRESFPGIRQGTRSCWLTRKPARLSTAWTPASVDYRKPKRAAPRPPRVTSPRARWSVRHTIPAQQKGRSDCSYGTQTADYLSFCDTVRPAG